MNVFIDFSVFTESSSLGYVHRTFEVNQKPEVGDYLDIGLSITKSNKFKVEHVSEKTIEGKTCVMIMLEDLFVNEHKDFVDIADYLKKKHGLFNDDFTIKDS